MSNKSCFFIGNRYTPDRIKEQLVQAVEKHIVEYGVNTFTVGHYGNFDSLVTGMLRGLKQKYTDIKIYLLAPYAFNQKIETPKDFDGIFYPDGLEFVPKTYAIVQANRLMIEQSEYLIAYSHNITGNTQKIVNYAKRREKKGLITVTLI